MNEDTELIKGAIAVICGLLLGWKSRLPMWVDCLIMVAAVLTLNLVFNHLFP